MKNKIFLSIGIILIVLSILFVGFLVYKGKKNLKKLGGLDIPSKCYTQLQPSHFFAGNPITINEQQKYIQLTYQTGELDTSQVADTGSMRPTIPDAGIVIIDKKPVNFQVGDIIIYECNTSYGKTLLHRIVKIENDTMIAKGDNNNIDDYKAFGCIANVSNIESKIVGILY